MRRRKEIVFRFAVEEHMQPAEHASIALFYRIEAFLEWKNDPARRPAHIGASVYRACAAAPLIRKGLDFRFDLKTVSAMSGRL